MSNSYNKMYNKQEIKIQETPNEIFIDGEKCTPEEVLMMTPMKKARVVHCDAVNIRKKPNKDGEVLAIAKLDELIGTRENINGWFQVVTKDGVEGYAMDEYIREE